MARNEFDDNNITKDGELRPEAVETESDSVKNHSEPTTNGDIENRISAESAPGECVDSGETSLSLSLEANCTTDEDDIAYVAERITGARHSRVTTAAPIRTRTNFETEQLTSLRRIMDDHAAKKTQAEIPRRVRNNAENPVKQNHSEDNSPKSKFPATLVKYFNAKKLNPILTVAAVVVAVVSIAACILIISGVNSASDKKRPSDHDIGEIGTNLKDNEIKSGNNGENPGNDRNDSDDKDDKTDTADTSESESESETEPLPEPEKFDVKLDFYDRDDIEISTEKASLSEILELCGVALGDGDVPSMPLDSIIAADVTVTIDKHEYKTESVSSEIPFETKRTETDLIPRGEKNYTQYGAKGQSMKYYNVEYVNGVEKNRTLEREEVVKKPVNEIYEEGVGGSFVGSDGVTYTYSYRRVVSATYYNIEGPTALGTMADETVVAVDRNNIPLGTKLYVKNDNYDFGVRTAADVGGEVKGWLVDIWIAKDNPQLPAFAKIGYHHDMEIYYID